jgi:hypothetical protein
MPGKIEIGQKNNEILENLLLGVFGGFTRKARTNGLY